ncbi:MAG: biopolymer transporter ExbD [Elusimicrobiota bacterium]
MSRYPLMRLRMGQDQAEPMTEVNIIPVIDISLVLLVILFVTAPLLSYPHYPIDLPRSSAVPAPGKTVALTCTSEERLAVGSRDSSWPELEDALRAELERSPGAGVVLRVDKKVPYRTVQRLLLAAKKAGAKEIALATDPYK